MSKVKQFRKRVAEKYHAFDLEEAARAGEALLREHWSNHSMLTLGYAQDIYNLGRIYDELGNFERAVELYTDGAHLFSRQCTGDATAYVACLNNLAAALFDMGMEEPSAHLFGQLVSVKRFFGHEPDEVFADCLYNLANSATEATRVRHATKWHTEALNIRRRLGHIQDIIDSLHSLAFLHEEKKEYEKAVPLAETARQLAQGDEYTGATHYLAGLYDTLGQYEKALPLYEEVMDLTRKRVGCTHHSYLQVTGNIAHILEKIGRPREAMDFQTERRALYEGMAHNHDYAYAQCLRHIADLHKQLGEYTQAEELLLRSLKLNRKRNTDMTEDMVQLIRLHLHRGDNNSALETLVYALMHSESRGPNLAQLLTKLAVAFNPTPDPAPDGILQALRVMNNREVLQPIIAKWTQWENEPFIPAFVMPPPAGQDKT
ncbi:MAG: tetratricopeptide repeat protein [Defluviitaleaceae bacterium]|nr:tetratricopeptide repeat protein [Defluviitaleaceae bacterium]MCL2240615.1 tetratricopeptide repeat protein [Defluviitaleaceae bacterium]